jgi:hypothetical protein
LRCCHSDHPLLSIEAIVGPRRKSAKSQVASGASCASAIGGSKDFLQVFSLFSAEALRRRSASHLQQTCPFCRVVPSLRTPVEASVSARYCCHATGRLHDGAGSKLAPCRRPGANLWPGQNDLDGRADLRGSATSRPTSSIGWTASSVTSKRAKATRRPEIETRTNTPARRGFFDVVLLRKRKFNGPNGVRSVNVADMLRPRVPVADCAQDGLGARDGCRPTKQQKWNPFLPGQIERASRAVDLRVL